MLVGNLRRLGHRLRASAGAFGWRTPVIIADELISKPEEVVALHLLAAEQCWQMRLDGVEEHLRHQDRVNTCDNRDVPVLPECIIALEAGTVDAGTEALAFADCS